MKGSGPRPALRAAPGFRFPRGWVSECLKPEDELFRRAWREGLDTVPPAQRRGRLPADTGQIAEAVAITILGNEGLDVFWQIVGLGTRGVDLLALTPEPSVLAVEVKGTLRAHAIPRPGRARERQMSVKWLNDRANPGMSEWDLEALDLFGAFLVVDFAASRWRAALTADLERYVPLEDKAQLLTPSTGAR